jgi:hypothetical protein
MLAEKLSKLNDYIQNHAFFEFRLIKFDYNHLVIAGSSDFQYYHEVEIFFMNVHTIICNTEFKLDTSKSVVTLVEDIEESRKLNLQYKVLVGNLIFRLIDEDDNVFYVIARDFDYDVNLVKYYSEYGR